MSRFCQVHAHVMHSRTTLLGEIHALASVSGTGTTLATPLETC